MRIRAVFLAGLNLLGLLLSVYATSQALALSRLHLSGPPVCPVLLGIPACLIVLLCYVLISISWGIALAGKQNRLALIVFLSGFTPAFLLAVYGSLGEIFGFAECPKTPNGFPKCFISFGFLIVLMGGWLYSSFLSSYSEMKDSTSA